jgi:hypothetical protein
MEKDAHSILEFCQRNDLSRSAYYNLKRLGQGPREMHTPAHAARW